jgi:general secretion pathway protein E/type IV pilus assembly protein PilB
LPGDFPAEALAAAGGIVYKAGKCRACHQTGYAGRMALFELLISSDPVRQLAHDRASSWDLRKVALQEGMTTLRDDGWRKVLEGRTSIDEIIRVTKGDRIGD